MRTGSDILPTNIPDLQSWISQSLNVAQNYKKTLIYAKSNLGTPKIRICIPAKDTTVRKALNYTRGTGRWNGFEYKVVTKAKDYQILNI